MPRFLSRLPYGIRTNPVDSFDFEEQTDGANHNSYSWANAAYAMAANINRSFKEYGWCTSIRGVESGGAVENLPCHTFPSDDGGVDMKCPTEIAISDRREAELAKTASCRWFTGKTPTLPPSLARNLCKNRPSTTIRMPPPMRVWPLVCRTCSPAAALPTI
jgi:type VI secretion system ImpC/EvpB family protein